MAAKARLDAEIAGRVRAVQAEAVLAAELAKRADLLRQASERGLAYVCVSCMSCACVCMHSYRTPRAAERVHGRKGGAARTA